MQEKWKIVFRFLRIAAIGIVLFVILAFGISWFAGHNTNHFKIDNHYEVTLTSDQCMTCFMDWSIDFEMIIVNPETGEEKEFEFHSPGGPEFIFGTNQNKEIVIVGYNECEWLNWIINFEEGSITKRWDGNDLGAYSPSCKLTTQFEIVEINNPTQQRLK